MSSNKASAGNDKEESSSAISNLMASANALVLEAAECIRAGKMKETIEKTTQAINECRAAVKLNPKYADAYCKMGILLTGQKRYNEAMDAYKKALEIDPVNEEYKDCLAAIEEKLKAINQEPSTLPSEVIAKANALKEEGNEFMKTSKFKEAIEKYTEAIALKPDAVYFCNRAAAHCGLKRYYDAHSDCSNATLLDWKYAKAHGRMGFVASCLGNYNLAVTGYKQALELNPRNENYKENLALAKAKLCEMYQQH